MTDTPPTTAWHPDRLLSPDEFCDWAGISKRTFRQWCTDGTAPPRLRIGKHIRIRWADALAWADSKRIA